MKNNQHPRMITNLLVYNILFYFYIINGGDF